MVGSYLLVVAIALVDNLRRLAIEMLFIRLHIERDMVGIQLQGNMLFAGFDNFEF